MSRAMHVPYGRQWIDEHDISSVVSVLKSNWITQGPKVKEFEEKVASYCGAKYAVAVSSGTAALHIACLAAGIEKGDEVITSPITFVASANCVLYCGGKPVFADIDSDTYNISLSEIEKKITKHTKAIIPVHFAGQSCDMETIKKIVEISKKKYGHEIYIIEDASHALGSLYKNKKTGSCICSDMTVMSFHAVKHITTGEGGAVLTNNADLFKGLKRFRSHGITNTPEEFVYKDIAFQSEDSGTQLTVNPWYYEQVCLGYNYRITDIQCALGLSQLRRLSLFIKRRREIVNQYNRHFENIDTIQIPHESSDCISNFHLYVLLFNFKKIGLNRAEFMTKLRNRGIQTQVHYIPVHTQPFYQKTLGTKWGDCPNAEKYYQKCLSIPLFPDMNEQDINRVVSEISEIAKK